MQIIYKNEDERRAGGRADPVDPVICAERGSGCVERERNGGVGNRRIGIQVSRGIFDKFKKRIL